MNTVTFPGLGLEFHVTSIAFSLFGWPIHWYGIIIATGFMLAVLCCSKVAKHYGIENDEIMDMLLYTVPLCIIGARIYYVVFYLDLYRRSDGTIDWPATVRIWDGGLAIYGAILMGILVVFLFCKKRGIPFLAFGDLASYGLLIGQLVGRWGNFVNVEAFGDETTLPWRMGIYGTVDGVYRYMEVHPTFLYESLWNLVGFLLLAFVVAKRRKFDGEIFWGYIAWYGLGRAWIEGLRTDSLYLFSTGIRVSQLLAILSFLGATVVLIVKLRQPNPPNKMWVNQKEAMKGRTETQDTPQKEDKTDG